MHCYLYAECKTPGCKRRLLVGHSEWPNDEARSIEYADEGGSVGVLSVAAMIPLIRKEGVRVIVA